MKNLVSQSILKFKEFWKSIKVQKPHVQITINGYMAQATLTEAQFSEWIKLIDAYFKTKAYCNERNHAQHAIYRFIESLENQNLK